MEYRDSWNMASVPQDVLISELMRRNSAKRQHFRGGKEPSCLCGTCRTCKGRINKAAARKLLKTQAKKA